MSEQLTRFFTAAQRLRRSERALVRAGAVMELEDLAVEAQNHKLKSRIAELLNAQRAKAS